MITRTSRCATLLALAVAAASAQAQTTPAMPAHAGAEHAGMLTQAQALGVLSAIDQSEVAAGQLAQKKVAAGPVRDYAARMVKEHSENEAKLSAWSPDRNAAPAKAQMAKGKQELATLQPLQEDAFRTAYVKAMVKGHTEALDALDHKLIPAAKDAQVKAFLQETRTHVASHLAAAKALQGDDAAAVPHQDGPTGAH